MKFRKKKILSLYLIDQPANASFFFFFFLMGAPLDKLKNFKLLKKKKKKKTISRVGVTQMIGRANSYSKSKIFLVFDNYIEYNRFQFFFFFARGGGSHVCGYVCGYVHRCLQ